MSQLVNGNIPSGKECPFLKECELKTKHCPSKENPLVRDYSCADARLYNIIKKVDKFF